MKTNKNLFKTYLIYFIVLAVFVGIRIASNLGAFSFIGDTYLKSGIVSIIIQVITLFLVPLFLIIKLFKKKPKQVFNDFYYKKISLKAILICFAIGFLMFFLNLIIATFFSSILSMFGYSSYSSGSGTSYDTFGKFIFGVVFVALLPALNEEFLHRGLLMRNIGSEMNYKSAIIISSVCFGLMHLNIEQVFYAIILGLIIGFVGAISDSIIPCMILHFMNNFLSVYFSYASSSGIPGSKFYSTLSQIVEKNSAGMVMIFALLIAVMIIIAMGYLILALFKETRLKKVQQSLLNVQKEISGEDIENIPQQKLSSDFSQYILPHLEKSDNMTILLPPSKNNNKQNLATNMFLYASLFLGFLITLFTFIWGVV